MTVPREYHLSDVDEKAEYELHENSPHDPGYRGFLGRIFKPLHDRLEAGSKGLDFGAGPGPTLSVMLEEVGHTVSLYDPFYSPDPAPLAQRFDFVTATEVVEHFSNPRVDFARMWSCVRPGGLLGLMTKLVIDEAAFSTWHYKNDPTHISFFSRDTFEWLADWWQADLVFVGNDVVLITKKQPR